MRKLGKNQEGVLKALHDHGNYHPTRLCGWRWSTEADTKRILDTLVKRGLVTINDEGYYIPVDKE